MAAEKWRGFCWEPAQRWMLRAALARVLGSGSLWDGEILGASKAIGLLCGLDEIRSETPLHHAAGEGRGDLVRLLLGARAAVDAKSGCSETPLDAARNSGHTEVVRILEAPTKGKGKQHGQKSAAAHTRGSDAS
ncbi:unnamed protein product [Durusdinium trenchii]|uniref:Uncharacterized protein n=1 Tax=Durusdinium trenchii TaxID=1381693 RepID=A0ABP0JCY9_9DINO